MTASTNDAAAAGRPRLIISLGGAAVVDPVEHAVLQDAFDLRPDVTTIGSDPAAHLRLDHIAGQHAEIVHDDADEYVFVQVSVDEPSHVNGVPMGTAVLRTGDRIEVGPHTMSFYREEYADHGRPNGGRQGGEGAIQDGPLR